MPATPPSTALARLGAWCFERRRRVLAGWVVALAIAIGVLGPLAGTFQADFLTPGSDSAAADAVMQERFPDRSSMTIDVVWHAAAGAQSPAVRERVDALLAKAERLPAIGAATATEVSRRRQDGDRAPADRRRERQRRAEGDGRASSSRSRTARRRTACRSRWRGWAINEAQESEVSPEVVGFAIAALVLLLTFGSLLAAGLPLLTAALRARRSARRSSARSRRSPSVPEFAPAVAGMMAIGVGIDYALLVITRYRSGLADGLEPRDAAAVASATAGRSVLVAGLTVVVALLGLYAMRLPFLNGVALSASLAVLVAAAAARDAAARDARLHRPAHRRAAHPRQPRPRRQRPPVALGRLQPRDPAPAVDGGDRGRPGHRRARRCRWRTSASASPTPATTPRRR